MNNNMVFAIFGSNYNYEEPEFVNFTYGMFMQLVSKPKIYAYSESQIETVSKNFRSKIRDIQKESEIDFSNPVANLIVNNGQNNDKKKLSDFSNFELRMYRTNHTYETWNANDIDLNNPDAVIRYQPYTLVRVK